MQKRVTAKMSIIDRIFAGKVIQDFGVLSEKSLGIGKIKHSALLVEKYGRLYFVIKYSTWFLLSGGVNYQKFALDDATKLRDYITESEIIAKNLPPLDYDVSKLAFRYSLITMLVATIINLLAQNSGIMFPTMFLAFFFHITQFSEFKNHPDVDAKTKRFLFIFPLITFLVSIPRFCYFTFVLNQ
jgi:hypothetical protein